MSTDLKPLTPDKLEALEALEAALEATTPGEWRTQPCRSGMFNVIAPNNETVAILPAYNNGEHNTRSIILLRNLADRLLAELQERRRLQDFSGEDALSLLQLNDRLRHAGTQLPHAADCNRNGWCDDEPGPYCDCPRRHFVPTDTGGGE